MTDNKEYYICVTPFFPTPKKWQGAYVLDQVNFFKQKTAYEIYKSDWSSDVCSSDLLLTILKFIPSNLY